MNYALGYAFNIHDMFAGFDTSRLDLDSKWLSECGRQLPECGRPP